MSVKETMKVLVMLAVVVGAVALYCYARVDLGLTQEQVNHVLEQWQGQAITWTVLIWSQIIVAAVAGLAYKIWRHRVESARAK